VKEIDTRDDKNRAMPAAPGLCGSCRNVRIITSEKGARFFMCQLSFRDPRFPKYPRLPVMQCEGYEKAEQPAASGG